MTARVYLSPLKVHSPTTKPLGRTRPAGADLGGACQVRTQARRRACGGRWRCQPHTLTTHVPCLHVSHTPRKPLSAFLYTWGFSRDLHPVHPVPVNTALQSESPTPSQCSVHRRPPGLGTDSGPSTRSTLPSGARGSGARPQLPRLLLLSPPRLAVLQGSSATHGCLCEAEPVPAELVPAGPRVAPGPLSVPVWLLGPFLATAQHSVLTLSA